MGKILKYTVDYRYTCEVCGEQTAWLEYTNQVETGMAILPGTMNGLLALGDVALMRNRLKSRLRKKTSSLGLVQGQTARNAERGNHGIKRTRMRLAPLPMLS